MKLCTVCSCVTLWNDIRHIEKSDDVCPRCAASGETPAQRQERMSAAFDRVKNAKHWKNPINKRLALTREEMREIEDAVIHFTGSVPTFTPCENGKYMIRAAGYYATIGA